MSAVLTPKDEAIAQRTAEIVLTALGKASAARVGEELHESVDVAGLQVMLGTRSRTTTYKRAKELGLVPYAPGTWRRKAVQNAIARADDNARGNARRKAA